MAWKRYSDEDALKNLLEIEVHLLGDMDVLSTCHTKPTPTCHRGSQLPREIYQSNA